MTVGETISSSSLVPGSQAPPPVQVVQQPHPPIDPINVTGVQQIPSAQVVPQDAVSNSGGIRSNTSTHSVQPQAHPMAAKVNQEILTSLHFIKDIRRLEKYQRDFFLKVKCGTYVESDLPNLPGAEFKFGQISSECPIKWKLSFNLSLSLGQRVLNTRTRIA